NIKGSKYGTQCGRNNDQIPFGSKIFLISDILAHHKRIIRTVPAGHKLSKTKEKSSRDKNSSEYFPYRSIIGLHTAREEQQSIKNKENAHDHRGLGPFVPFDQFNIVL